MLNKKKVVPANHHQFPISLLILLSLDSAEVALLAKKAIVEKKKKKKSQNRAPVPEGLRNTVLVVQAAARGQAKFRK
jgi:hypothetical protein